MQLNALLEDIYSGFVADVAASRGKTKEEVEALLDEGVFDMQVGWWAGGWAGGRAGGRWVGDAVQVGPAGSKRVCVAQARARASAKAA